MFNVVRLRRPLALSLLCLVQATVPGCAAGRTSAEGAANPDPADAALAAEGLTRPELKENPVPFDYTWEAFDARVEGLISVQCLITEEGFVRNCRVRKSLPHMDEMVLLTLYRQRYVPAKKHGQPIPIHNVFNVQFEIPLPGAGRKLDFFTVADYRAALDKLCAGDDSPCGPISL